ncbi:hypothetical protein CEXT_671761 [Caerostris extrusa]|uniref:Uncharacterized protein n=1 Tax=Caerostris extrusa TaxID=172846 RepID=A0AAV4XE18_CAEEX|nr:hypothetical protein CEXT_671761 [Caerostris extrusa]
MVEQATTRRRLESARRSIKESFPPRRHAAGEKIFRPLHSETALSEAKKICEALSDTKDTAVGETPGKSCSERTEPPSLNPCAYDLCGHVACMTVFSVISCPLYVQVPWGKTRLRTAYPSEDDDPRQECGPDPWNFAAQIDWEVEDDGYTM